MDGRDDVPAAADIFLRRKPSRTPRKARSNSRPDAPGLFDTVAAVTVTETTPTASLEAAAPKATEPEAARVWSVAELVREVRELVEKRYARITVEGEISNWRPAASGHCYFTLKDGDAQLAVVMFRRESALLRFKPKDGDAVRMRGQVSVYESRGQMQMIAESMELAGIGAQLAAVQELKAKLKREGLFANKRPLPAFPKCIGVITSLQGAALRDIVKVCRRRHAAVNLLIYPVAVQGPRCAAEVVEGLAWFNAHLDRVDVVMVARGGGSWEDLHGFDDERVARAIASCKVPVVAGIGHATDTTIADAAADVCAPTPSAAAELVTAAQHKVQERVARLEQSVQRAGGYELLRARQRLSGLSAEQVLRRMRDGLGRREQRLDELEFRAHTAAVRAEKARRERLTRIDSRLQRQDARRKLEDLRRKLDAARRTMQQAGANVVALRAARVDQVWARAEAMSPLRVLERGYALVYGPSGKLLRAADQVEVGETVVARLAEGAVSATVSGHQS